MLSSPSQGALLSFFATLNRAVDVLELGSFTGYSALSMAMDYDTFSAKNTTTFHAKRRVWTCEIDPKASEIATNFFEKSGLGDNIRLHRIPAFEMISKMKCDGKKFDM